MRSELNLGFSNINLYKGCHTAALSRRKFHLYTSPREAIPIVRANLKMELLELQGKGATAVMFTGAVPPWVYLLAGAVATDLRFAEIWYTDTKSEVQAW